MRTAIERVNTAARRAAREQRAQLKMAKAAEAMLVANFREYVAQLTPFERAHFTTAGALFDDYITFEEARQ